MRTLISFATAEYRSMQQRLARSAQPFFHRIESFGPQDLDADFVAANAGLFVSRRGYGYWCWKPWLILRQLLAMGPDDELMYADSQCLFESDPSPLFAVLEAQAERCHGIGLFHQQREGHRNQTWTRGDCFRLMGCDEPRYRIGDNLATTYSIWRRTPRSIDFAREWLKWCCDRRVVSDDPGDAPNAMEFRDHRHDQSIASLLAIRDELFTLCDCTQFGDGYRCEHCHYPRILNVDRTVVAPWLLRPDMSSIIEVSTIGACPLRCSYCPQDKLQAVYQGPEQIDLELFQRCLDHLTPGDAIYFAGFVEPCLHPEIVALIELCLGRGHRTRLYTTGRGLDLEQARAIAASNIEEIILHLPDVHGHLKHAASAMPAIFALARHPRCSAMTMDHQPHPDFQRLYDSLPQNHGLMNSRAGNVQGMSVITANHRGPIRCGVAPQLDHSVLLPDGRLALCCMTYSLEHIVGNLAAKPYAEILRDGPIRELLRAQRDGGEIACRRCVCAVPA